MESSVSYFHVSYSVNSFLIFSDEQAKPLPGLSAALPHPEFLHSSSSRPGQLATPDILPHSLLLATHQVLCIFSHFVILGVVISNLVDLHPDSMDQ
jgi:hypothetical protein